MSGDNEQLTSDLTKANEILHRKIDEIKQIKEKYKRNAEIIKRQEEILNQKDQDLKVRTCFVFMRLSLGIGRIIFKYFSGSWIENKR